MGDIGMAARAAQAAAAAQAKRAAANAALAAAADAEAAAEAAYGAVSGFKLKHRAKAKRCNSACGLRRARGAPPESNDSWRLLRVWDRVVRLQRRPG